MYRLLYLPTSDYIVYIKYKDIFIYFLTEKFINLGDYAGTASRDLIFKTKAEYKAIGISRLKWHIAEDLTNITGTEKHIIFNSMLNNEFELVKIKNKKEIKNV